MKHLRVLTVLAGWLALAAPSFAALCNVPGRQDATCLSAIVSAGPARPSCGAGQTTLTPAQWTGSSWTNPVCQASMPPAPTAAVCQYGFSSGPAWNGSSWAYTCAAGPACAPGQTLADYVLPNSYYGTSFSAGGNASSPQGGNQYLVCGYSNSVGWVAYSWTSGWTTTAIGLTFGVSGRGPNFPAMGGSTYFWQQSCSNHVCSVNDAGNGSAGFVPVTFTYGY